MKWWKWSMTDDRWPMTDDRWPMTDDRWPTIDDQRSTTDDRRLTTDDWRWPRLLWTETVNGQDSAKLSFIFIWKRRLKNFHFLYFYTHGMTNSLIFFCKVRVRCVHWGSACSRGHLSWSILFYQEVMFGDSS